MARVTELVTVTAQAMALERALALVLVPRAASNQPVTLMLRLLSL